MSAKVERLSAEKKFSELEDGDWFIDVAGDLCVKIEEFANDEELFNIMWINEDKKFESGWLLPTDNVYPVQVTISY